MSGAMTKAERALEAARTSRANISKRIKEAEQSLARTALGTVAAAGYGMARRNNLRASVGGVPVKVGVGLLAMAAALTAKGAARRALTTVGDVSIWSYTENAVASGSFVAGDDESGGGL